MKLRPVDSLPRPLRRAHSLIPGSPPLFGGGSANIAQLSHSLRFNDADSANLSRTFSAGTATRWTKSMWVRRADLEVGTLFAAYSSAGNFTEVGFGVHSGDGERLEWVEQVASSNTAVKSTTMKLRDVHGFYHLQFTWDTAAGTAADRQQIRINGQRITDWNADTDPGLSDSSFWNTAIAHHIGQDGNSGSYFHGQLADVYLVDNQALTGTEFAQFNTATKNWTVKIFGGNFGTTGYRLTFSDGTNTTTLGEDSAAGGSNDWTLNNLATTDQLTDNPSKVYTALTPLEYDSTGTRAAGTYSEANMKWVGPSGVDGIAVCSHHFPAYGNWYMEVTLNAAEAVDIGLMDLARSQVHDFSTTIGDLAACYTYRSTGNQELNGSENTYGASFTNGDVIGIHFDRSGPTSSITFYKNGSSQGLAWTAIVNNSPWVLTFGEASSNADITVNCGQRPFAHTPPTGAVGPSTVELNDPPELDGREHNGTVLWTGNDSNPRTITDTDDFKFNAGTLITSARASGSATRQLFNSNVGSGRRLPTASNAARTDFPSQGYNTDFPLGGISVINGASGDNDVNDSTIGTYCAHGWENHNAYHRHFAWTGNASNPRNLAHGMSVTPVFVIGRVNDTSNSGSWYMGHQHMAGTTPWNYHVVLEGSAARVSSANVWNNTAPSATNVTIGSTLNASGPLYLGLFFGEVEGYSAFPYYIANGSTDGPFVFTGFAPSILMIRRVDAGGNFIILDRRRDTSNPRQQRIRWNDNAAEASLSGGVDFLANGFKIRTTDSDLNTAGGRYVVAAFATWPTRYAPADCLIPD